MRLLLAALLIAVSAGTVTAQEDPYAAAGRAAFLAADYATARQYLEPLAESRDAEAQFDLGLMQAGAGDDADADFWFSLLGLSGYPGAAHNADVLAQRLQTYDVHDAVRRAHEWRQTRR